MEDEIVFAIKTGYKRILLELIAKKKPEDVKKIVVNSKKHSTKALEELEFNKKRPC